MKVIFKRVYEISDKDIMNRFDGSIYNDPNMPNKGFTSDISKEIAKDRLSDEMPLFANNINDFVSAEISTNDE